jgi:hypothetical protein
MAAQVLSLDQARALIEARKILKASIPPGAVIWKRSIRNNLSTAFRRAVLVELLPNLDLRVTDVLSGERIAQGPTRVGDDRFNSAQG